MKKTFITFSLILIVVLTSKAQQQVSYTQYMFNGMAINPGYIGSHGGLSATTMMRWQWLGIEGAPRTQTLAVHTPVPNKNIGFGLQVTRDEIAVTNLTSVFAGYSYRLPVGSGVLSMGVQGGLQNFNNDLTSVYTINKNIDQAFQENASSMKPNFGVGLFYSNPIFYLGLSSPELIQNQIEADGLNLFTQKRHYFMTSGVVFNVAPIVKLKPNLLVRIVEGAPVSVDYNLNVLLHEILWLGISVRPPESMSFLVEFNVNQKFRVGYAYDYIIDQTLSDRSSGSHEVMLNYRLKWSRDKVVTPRYF